MGDPLIKVVRTLLDDRARQEKSVKEFDLDNYFKVNNNAIVSNVSTREVVTFLESSNHRKSAVTSK